MPATRPAWAKAAHNATSSFRGIRSGSTALGGRRQRARGITKKKASEKTTTKETESLGWKAAEEQLSSVGWTARRIRTCTNAPSQTIREEEATLVPWRHLPQPCGSCLRLELFACLKDATIYTFAALITQKKNAESPPCHLTELCPVRAPQCSRHRWQRAEGDYSNGRQRQDKNGKDCLCSAKLRNFRNTSESLKRAAKARRKARAEGRPSSKRERTPCHRRDPLTTTQCTRIPFSW